MYDFFIAHAGADAEAAERLYGLLAKGSQVFLDTKSLRFGDLWDVELPRAQRDSRFTVVMVSGSTEQAFFQKEEILAAIDLARRESHRVVPVFIDGPPGDDDQIPYGLRRIHRAVISEKLSR